MIYVIKYLSFAEQLSAKKWGRENPECYVLEDKPMQLPIPTGPELLAKIEEEKYGKKKEGNQG
jgi:hypothetical protein